ncbi:MAG: hypothetical protein ACOZCO_01385 [Bacteroidota bacterium]
MISFRLPYKSPSFYAILFTAVVLIWINFNIRKWGENDAIKSDVISYYAYLPAFFIEQCPDLSFTDGKEDYYAGTNRYWPEKAPNGKKVIKTTMGMAVLYSPFFAIAHAEAKMKGETTDGFSQPYHKWIHLSGVFYCLMGLIFLRKLLLRFFKEWIVFFSLLLVVFGTNLFHYSTAEAALSHAPGFALIAAFIFFSVKWKELPSVKNSVMVSLLLGMIMLVRPVNLLIAVFPLLYGVKNKNEFKLRIQFLWQQRKYILLMALITFLVLLPQFIYWKYITDSWMFNSYVGERFYFSHPHIAEGFLSFRKGWLVYTPLMIFSLAGFYFVYKKYRDFFLPLLVFFILNSYVIFSWWCWWYGGGLGMRPMIDSYALLFIPLAAFLQFVYTKRKYLQIIFFSLLILVFSAQNIFQSWQLRNGIIHWDSMTREAYTESLLQLHGNEKIKNALRAPDYDKARKGEDEYDFIPK